MGGGGILTVKGVTEAKIVVCDVVLPTLQQRVPEQRGRAGVILHIVSKC